MAFLFSFFLVAMTPRVNVSRRVSAQVAVHRRQQVQSHRAAHAAKQPQRSLSDPRITDQCRFVSSGRKWRWINGKGARKTTCLLSWGRWLLVIYPEEVRLSVPRFCKALPYFLPPERLVLHISQAHLPFPASPGGTLLRSVPRGPRSAARTFIGSLGSSTVKGRLFSECEDGLCCRLTAPCFIKSSERETKLVRRPTFNWKDISRCVCGGGFILTGPKERFLNESSSVLDRGFVLMQVLFFVHVWESSASSRSMVFKRKLAESDNPLVSEGLREAISSYLQMTEGSSDSWETWGCSHIQRGRCNLVLWTVLCLPGEEAFCTDKLSICWPARRSRRG